MLPNYEFPGISEWTECSLSKICSKQDILGGWTMNSKQRKGKSVGTFKVDVEVAKVTEHPEDWKSFRKVLVDTGSEATWLPEEDLIRMGIKIFKKDVAFLMPNGQVITRDVGIALIRTGAFKTVDEVVFAKPSDLLILGAHTLEGFPATVDVYHKKLVASGPMPAAAA